jgi:hypothetical protein
METSILQINLKLCRIKLWDENIGYFGGYKKPEKTYIVK